MSGKSLKTLPGWESRFEEILMTISSALSANGRRATASHTPMRSCLVWLSGTAEQSSARIMRSWTRLRRRVPFDFIGCAEFVDSYVHSYFGEGTETEAQRRGSHRLLASRTAP